MKKTKLSQEVAQQVRVANYKIIMNMCNDGWCAGCKEKVDDCLRRGKCKGQEELEDVKQKDI